jgi:translation initiation factor IF-3
MRIHHRRRGGYQKKEELVQYNVNEQILAPEVRVIDENSEMIGVLPTAQAIATAQERGYDLVEVSPKAVPPVCRFIDYGQFKYQKEKELKAQKAHAKKVDIKGIRLSVKMGENDFNTRLAKAKEFLADGDKLKIELMLRGREKEHGNIGKERIQDFLDLIQQEYELSIEQPITRNGGNVSTIVGRKS